MGPAFGSCDFSTWPKSSNRQNRQHYWFACRRRRLISGAQIEVEHATVWLTFFLAKRLDSIGWILQVGLQRRLQLPLDLLVIHQRFHKALAF